MSTNNVDRDPAPVAVCVASPLPTRLAAALEDDPRLAVIGYAESRDDLQTIADKVGWDGFVAITDYECAGWLASIEQARAVVLGAEDARQPGQVFVDMMRPLPELVDIVAEEVLALLA